MSNHSERARELFEQGYNCAQSVFAAFCDETGMEFGAALRLSSSFGGGMDLLELDVEHDNPTPERRTED